MRTSGTTPLDHYIKPLLDYRKLIVAVVGVVVLAGIALWFLLPSSYTSSTSVLLRPISADPLDQLESDTNAEIDIPTELLIATSKAVLNLAVEDLAAQSISVTSDEMSANVSATSPRNTKILEVAFEASTPQLAQVGADTVARNYLVYRAGIAADNRSAAVEALDQRVSLLKENLTQVETDLVGVDEGTQSYVALGVERDSLLAELKAQQEALAALSTLTVDAGEILDPAALPTNPSGVDLLTIIVGAVAAGLVLGSVLAMLLGAIKASRAPRNRRATDEIEHNRRQEDRTVVPRRVPADRVLSSENETAVEKLARVTAGRDSVESMVDDQELGEAEPAAEQTEPRPTMEPVETAPTVESVELADPGKPAELVSDAAPTASEAFAESPEADAGVVFMTEHSSVEPAVEVPLTNSEMEPPPPPAPRPRQLHNGVRHLAHEGVPTSDNIPLPPKRPKPVINDDIPPPPPPQRKRIAAKPVAVAHPSGTSSRLQARVSDADVVAPGTSLRVVPNYSSFAPTLGRSSKPLALLTVGEASRADAVAAAFSFIDAVDQRSTEILIIDAVLDEPIMSNVLKLQESPGLSEVLSGQSGLDSAVKAVHELKLVHAISAGRPSVPAKSALSTETVREILRTAKRRYGLTIVVAGNLDDAAMITRAGDALDGILLSARHEVGHEASGELESILRDLPAPILIRVSADGIEAAAKGETAAAAI